MEEKESFEISAEEEVIIEPETEKEEEVIEVDLDDVGLDVEENIPVDDFKPIE